MPLNVQTREKLISLVPYGLVASKAWLVQEGLSRHSIDNLVKSRQLIPIAHGVYRRPETTLSWQGIVASLQRMGSNLTVGGLTALDLQGMGHYLFLSDTHSIHLYGTDKLPSWVNQVLPQTHFTRHGTARLFENGKQTSPPTEAKSIESSQRSTSNTFTIESAWGNNDHHLRVSTLERAILETLQGVPKHVSFEHADQLMDGLSNLSPRRLDQLLRRVVSIKAIRLFFWLADRHKHQWRSKLAPEDFNLGTGKRVLTPGGKLDRKYLITVPENMHG